MRKNSYISKMFKVQSFLLVVIVVFISASIYDYSKKVIRDEMASLNNAILSETSENISRVVVDSIALCNKIVYDSRLVELLRTSNREDPKRNARMATYVGDTIDNYIWSNGRNRNLFEASVIEYSQGEDFHDYTEAKGSFVVDEGTVLINTSQNIEEDGIYRYAFQVVSEIKDYITQEPYGVVVLNISEVILYDTYFELNTNGGKIFIIDEHGTIISNKDKKMITHKYLNRDEIEDNLGKRQGYTLIKNNGNTTMALVDIIQGTSWYLIKEVGTNKIWTSLENIKIFTVLITILGVYMLILLSKYFSKKISQPIIDIKDRMEQVTKGDLDVRATVRHDDEFGQIAVSFNEMVEQIEWLLISVKEEEHKKRLAELDFLNAQINPHFIYNTLSSIRFYVEINKNIEAGEMLFHFSKILRKTLSRSDEFITIRDEIKTIKDYVELQKLRYADSFEVFYTISKEILDYMIPTFILQPIVENSIFYTVGEREHGIITIIGKYEKNKIKIKISDNGTGMSKEQINQAFDKEMKVNKVGLINVHERIQLNYGLEYGLNIESQDGGGTQVIFTLPAIIKESISREEPC